MATIKSFEDLEIWKDARSLAKEIYKLTYKIDFSKDFSLKDQIRRSSSSVMDNVAEGFDNCYTIANKIGKMIGGFIKYLQQSDYRGNKFKEDKILYEINPNNH